MREGSTNNVVRAVGAVAEYEDQLAKLCLLVPELPTNDRDVDETRQVVAALFVELARLDQALGLGVEELLLRRFEQDPAAAAEGRAA